MFELNYGLWGPKKNTVLSFKHNGSHFSGQRLVFEPQQRRIQGIQMRRAKKKSQAKKICSLQGKGSSDGPSHLSWISGKGNGRTVERLQKNVKIQSTRSTSQVNTCQHMSTSQVNMPESAGCPHCVVGQLWHVFCLGWSRKLCGHLSHFSQYSQARAFPSFTTAFGAIWPRTPIIPPAISKEIWYLVISCRVTKQLWIGPAWSGLTIWLWIPFINSKHLAAQFEAAVPSLQFCCSLVGSNVVSAVSSWEPSTHISSQFSTWNWGTSKLRWKCAIKHFHDVSKRCWVFLAMQKASSQRKVPLYQLFRVHFVRLSP